jgi:deoxyribonuclease-4
VKIALETTAGQGTTLGYRFEQLRDMIAGCREPERLSVCLDTCHLFAAGYDIRDEDGYQRTLQSFHEVIGLDKLSVIHLNDSKRELGSRVDRHDHIGHGRIGETAFGLIMNDNRMVSIPKLLETPKGEDDSWDRKNLEKLGSMLNDVVGPCNE